MSLSWISNRSLKVSPKVRLVDDGEAEVLRQKLAALTWRPENGFLKDREQDAPASEEQAERAA
jgi:hypothetical protein